MMIVATLLLVLALPFLLWPLLRPAPAEPVPEGPADTGEALFRSIEEVQLDLASGRLDQAEAERRIGELRRATP